MEFPPFFWVHCVWVFGPEVRTFRVWPTGTGSLELLDARSPFFGWWVSSYTELPRFLLLQLVPGWSPCTVFLCWNHCTQKTPPRWVMNLLGFLLKKSKTWKMNMEPTKMTRLERKTIFQTSIIMFHVILQGCNNRTSTATQFYQAQILDNLHLGLRLSEKTFDSWCHIFEVICCSKNLTVNSLKNIFEFLCKKFSLRIFFWFEKLTLFVYSNLFFFDHWRRSLYLSLSNEQPAGPHQDDDCASTWYLLMDTFFGKWKMPLPSTFDSEAFLKRWLTERFGIVKTS